MLIGQFGTTNCFYESAILVFLGLISVCRTDGKWQVHMPDIITARNRISVILDRLVVISNIPHCLQHYG